MKRKPIPFSKFIDESTNKLTCFGVLNAFSIISSQNKMHISGFITFSVLILSLLIYIELFKQFWISYNGSVSYILSMALLFIIFSGLFIDGILLFKNEFWLLLYLIEILVFMFVFLSVTNLIFRRKYNPLILLSGIFILMLISYWFTFLIHKTLYSWIINFSEFIEKSLDPKFYMR